MRHTVSIVNGLQWQEHAKARRFTSLTCNRKILLANGDRSFKIFKSETSHWSTLGCNATSCSSMEAFSLMVVSNKLRASRTWTPTCRATMPIKPNQTQSNPIKPNQSDHAMDDHLLFLRNLEIHENPLACEKLVSMPADIWFSHVSSANLLSHIPTCSQPAPMFGPGPHVGSQWGLLAETISFREHQYQYPKSLNSYGVHCCSLLFYAIHELRQVTTRFSFFMLQSEWHQSGIQLATEYCMLDHVIYLTLSDHARRKHFASTIWMQDSCSSSPTMSPHILERRVSVSTRGCCKVVGSKRAWSLEVPEQSYLCRHEPQNV